MVSQKEGVISELRDEAYTLLASGWLTFRRKVAKVFPGLDFNFQVPIKGEAEESDSDDEADPVVFSNALSFVPLPGELEIEAPAEAGSPTMTPHSRGSVDYPSTHGIQVDVGLPDATSKNRAESPLYGELYPNKTPA